MGDGLRSAAEGVDTILWLAAALAAAATTGKLFLDRRPWPFDRVPATRLSVEDRRALWDVMVALTGEAERSAIGRRRARRRPLTGHRRVAYWRSHRRWRARCRVTCFALA